MHLQPHIRFTVAIALLTLPGSALRFAMGQQAWREATRVARANG
jgi:hypothetical protein